ncbi:hypothetical protein HMPREF1544_01857 [Mucor circinelloides 1006PhL]|uniref:Uncharacterized protein n=1 Tax=Mucor circinelloides f. circinelloides (strain 1006PhL) TaxID=1220926 RepID=S2KG20_MUCC1|nr:hypothetical protein HMPREF1544_01857 [Mucor circinelloides 1006PhL]
MRALLDQEVDMEELFEYRDSDEEDEEFSTNVVEEEEEDKVDSDFDLDSSEGEQEHIEEGQAMDKELDKAEKRTLEDILIYDLKKGKKSSDIQSASISCKDQKTINGTF